MTEQVENTVTVQLDGDVDNITTTWTVDDGSALPASGDFRLRCENEIVKATARTGNDVTVVRGSEGTGAGGHDDGTAVKMVHSAEALIAIIGESEPAQAHGVSVKLTTQVVAASSWGALRWDTLIHETAAKMWDISSPGRLIADRDGLWLLTVTWWWVANVNGQRYHRIYVNGALYSGEVDWLGMRTDNPIPYNTRSRVLDLNDDDYVQVQVYQTTTGNLNVAYATAELTYLGGPLMSIAVPTAGAPILDTWGAAVANQLNKLIPIAMTADQASDSATAVNLTELAVEMISGRAYNVRLFGSYQASATNQGLKLSWSGPGHSSAVMAARIWGNGGPTTEARYRTTSGALVGQTTTDSAAAVREFWADFRYVASATGTWHPAFARGGTSGSTGITILAGTGAMCIEIA